MSDRKTTTSLRVSRLTPVNQGLASRLQAIGVQQTERSIANKMSRGTFSFAFVLQCLKAIGAESLSFVLTEEVSLPVRQRFDLNMQLERRSGGGYTSPIDRRSGEWIFRTPSYDCLEWLLTTSAASEF
jgi:hypothetical protein